MAGRPAARVDRRRLRRRRTAAASRATLQGLVEDRRGINFKGPATPEQLTLDEMTWLDPAVGVVPGDEKADPGNAIQLRAATPWGPRSAAGSCRRP